jgi:hypothetical protein
MQDMLFPDGEFFQFNQKRLTPRPLVKQWLPSDFLLRDPGTENADPDRDALHALLTELMPHILREAVLSNSRLKSIQMPEVIGLKDHTDACQIVFEMLQSPEIVHALVLMVLQHTLGDMFQDEGVGCLFEEALWKLFQRPVHSV